MSRSLSLSFLPQTRGMLGLVTSKKESDKATSVFVALLLGGPTPANLGQLPARLTAEQAGWVLNCQQHDIPALVSSRLLIRRQPAG